MASGLLAHMSHLSDTVHDDFMPGNHSISGPTQPFAEVWTGMALEQSINLVSETTGGIIGIIRIAGALERWFLTCHERAAMWNSIVL